MSTVIHPMTEPVRSRSNSAPSICCGAYLTMWPLPQSITSDELNVTCSLSRGRCDGWLLAWSLFARAGPGKVAPNPKGFGETGFPNTVDWAWLTPNHNGRAKWGSWGAAHWFAWSMCVEACGGNLRLYRIYQVLGYWCPIVASCVSSPRPAFIHPSVKPHCFSLTWH